MEQLPESLIQFDTEENRRKYQEYLDSATQNSAGFTINYKGNEYKYTAEDVDRIKRGYDSMRMNEGFYNQSADSYTDSAFDQYAYQHGLPSWKMWQSVEKYSSGGGINENYGNLSDDQWKKINELWQKDWEYGLTDTDYARKAAGLAPSSYDDMYENTLLDQELKANGLPPSKLLNGKLGETYRAWEKDAQDFVGFNDAVTRKMIENEGKLKSADYAADASDAFGRAASIIANQRNKYSLQDAINDTMNDPKWREFASKHYGYSMELPDRDSEDYLSYDDNGNSFIDEEKYAKDLEKAQKNNIALESDEFALTNDGIKKYYDEYAAFTKADIDAEKWFTDQGINFDYGTRFMNESYLKKMDDFAIANAVKENGGITIESLFPGVEISETEKITFQPLINDLNRVLAEGGASALDDYMASGEFKAAVKNVENQNIVANMRERYADVPGYDKKTDGEVLHDYWKNIGKEYNMSDDDIAKLESGEITVQSYMTDKCSTDQNARNFAEAQYLQYCKDNYLPTTSEEWREAITASKEVGIYVGTEVGDADKALLNTSEESWDKMLEYWTPIANKYSTWQEAYDAEDNGVTDTNHFTTAVEEWEYAKNIVSQANTAKGIYANIKAINRFYDPSKSWDQQPQYSRQMWDAAYGYRQTLLADALSYSPEFAAKTGDKDYINQRFEQIVNSYGDEGIELNFNPSVLTLTAIPGIGMTAAIGAGVYDALTREKLKDIHEYATDEDKAKVVYMFDTNGNTTQSSTYLQSMMHQWDAERRVDKEETTQFFNAEGKTGFGRWAGAVGTMLHSAAFGTSEGVVNLLTDTASLVMGKDIFSSNRMTATSDRMANLSQHLEDKDGNKIGSFAVNLIPTMAQSGMGMALATMTGGASEAFTLALMGTQAYSGAVDTALRNGATAEQAYVYGLMSGANEMIFEKLSLDKFIADVDVVNAIATAASASGASTKKLAGVLVGSMLKHVGTQGFVEGSEELFTSIANQLCENLILGSKSAFNKTVEHYIQAGMSEEDARNLAAKEIMQDITVDFIGGFISGGLMAFGGDIIQTRGGKYIFDRTGMTDFLNQTHDLSLISADTAIAYAKNNLSKGSGGEYTLESTQKVFSELRKQGADSATLRRVMNAISDDATQGARTVMESEIGEQRRVDEKKLIGAASKYVYNKRNGKASVSASEVARVTNEYLDNLSNTVQQSDIRNVQAAVRAMQAGYVEEIKSLAGRGNMQTGYRVMNDYYNSLSVEAKDEIAQSATKFANVFAHATTNGVDAGRYALSAAIFEYATKDGNALVSLDAIFGDSAGVAPNAIENACLNTNETVAKNFIDAVWAGIGMLHTQDGSHLFKAAQHGVNAQTYVASQMALAQSMPETSMSRAMYDYIIKYGATSETMDLLTAANIYEAQGNTAKTIATNFGHFYTNSELAAITSAYDKAATNYNNKTKIMEAHQQADATALAAEQGRVAALEARVAEIQPLLESNTELADAYAKTASELQSAKDALNKLVAEQNKRMASTEADLESARAEFAKARMAYQMAMRDHSAQYVQRFGANLEAIKGGQQISHAELSRMNALVTYGTAENLNDINEKILASEKSAAVALGRALGADVQCVSFGNDAFLQEHNIPDAERESAKTRKGFRDGGTIYLNTDVMKADVGSLTNEVLLHEIGHYLENSIDDYKKYAKFAKDFLIARDGLETYNAAAEQFGADELVAEFTRQVALADPRAVAALCKSAPNMSMRVFQWLTNTQNKMTSVAASQSKIIRDAQRAFAKGLKAYRGTNVRAETNSESAANIEPTRNSLENALRAMADRARLDEQNAAQQTQEQTAQPEAPSETTEATAETEAEATTQTTEETTPTVEEAEEAPAQPVAEESEQPAETAEEMPAEETTAEEQPTEEPKEDFADVVLEEQQGDTEQKNAPAAEPQTEQPAETAQGDRDNEAQRAQLPFNLTSETRQRIMLVVAQMRAQNSDSEGRVPKKTNDTIAKIVKNQVKNDANYVATSEDILDAFAEQFKAPQRETEAVQGRHDWTSNYRSTENRNAGVAADSANSQAIEYYTEYDPEYLDLAKRYESGDKSVEAELRKAVDDAAKAAGYNYKGFHGTNSGVFTVFSKEKLGSNTNAPSAKKAFFAAASMETASSYKFKEILGLGSDFPAADASENRGWYEEIRKKYNLDNEDWKNRNAKKSFDARYMLDNPNERVWNGDYDEYEPDAEIQEYFDNMQKAWEASDEYKQYAEVRNRASKEYKSKVNPRIIPLYVKMQNPYVADFHGEGRYTSFNSLLDYAKQNNYDGCIFQNVADGAGLDTIFAVFDNTQFKSADLITKDDNGNIIPLSERFKTNRTGEDAWKNEDIRYYTEYDPQALAVKRSIDKLSEQENRMSGKPRMIQTNNGYVVARKVSMDGFSTGNPMFNADRQSIAMIAPVSEFRNGDVKQAVPVSRCTAVVVPGTDAYASVRADARSAGANVYAYDESDSTQFDRAIDRAANAKKVQFMPEMTYDEWLKRYGMIKKGTGPRVDRPVPRQTTDTNRVSRMVRTGMEAPVTTEDTAERIRGRWLANGTGTFEPVSNARTLEKARGVIERAGSIAQAAEDLHRDVANGGGKATDLLARAELLYAEMQDPDADLTDQEREQIFGDMVIIASDAGRALQLATELKRMTPDGHIAYIEQVGKRMEDRYNKRTGKRTHLELTQEEKDKYRRAVTQEQREEVDKEVGKRWAEETSDLTLLDRIRNWRYFSMLGNPRTHFRNMVGNALMNPIARMKDTVNAGLQAAFGVDRSERTSAAWTGRVDDATKAWVNERLKEALPVMQGVSSKYTEEITSNAKPDTDIEGGWFKRTITALTQPVQSARLSNSDNAWGRFWNKLSYANSNALEMEDALALGMRFRSVMYQLIKARGLDINSMTEQQQKDIMEVAMEESLRATFRDASKLADALNRFANTNKATKFAMEAIVPFKKTPINIARRSFEYSPIGLATGLYKTISNEASYKSAVNSINSDTKLTDAQKQQQIDDLTRDYKSNKIAAIDRLAQGTTGSILTAIGIFAASMGWISIGRKDDEGASFEQGLGKNAYSLNIGDVSIDLSAFSPAAVPMLMGTALYQSLNAEHDPNLVSSLISVLTESIDPITEMSMLSGIADALSGIGSQREDGANTRWAMQIAGNALESYVGQFVPTFVGQTARAFDPYARSYTAGDDYWASKAFGSEIGTSVKGLQNKIGLGWLSEPKVNLHGDEQRNYTNFGSWVMNAANNWILPATIKMDQKNEIDDELVRLYGVTDSGDLFPTKPSRNLGVYTDKKTGTKQNIKITSDAEYTQYSKEYGQTVYDMLDDLIRSPKYRRMTDEQKAEAVADIIDQAKSATRKRWKAQKVAGNKK